ncbi:hypothetical protein CHO01_22390 [Cellulomonas hominis]|uniref:HEAT repeat domain-containing protein n=1 Tax=Cellulomonas hominis TaxID=156981 RepID=A0A511FD37_9CELL|nr:hypothetical protein [Cellulomonas hominis]MBB5475214.1 hypothetical protein [Cellulomonas hominis]NKY06783.1 hypothetical protein [Cellulomonas hominis]GEL47123.1 hypothetical protein CHO01_22390 [Cellulomonas hominis]
MPRAEHLTDDQVRGLLAVMAGATPLPRGNVAHQYLPSAGPDLVPLLAEAYGSERRAPVRRDLVTFAGSRVRTDPRVLELAASALRDRAPQVRGAALFLYARTEDPAVVPTLLAWSPPTEGDAGLRDRAIRAARERDVQEWVRFTAYDEIVPWSGTTEAPGSPEFCRSVDVFIREYAASLVPGLERVLGSLYLEHLAPRP